MRTFIRTIALIAASVSSAVADIGIYAGTESQTTKHEPSSRFSNPGKDIRLSGRMYLVYDFDSNRCVEIRIRGTEYLVRTERTLQRQRFLRLVDGARIREHVFSGVGEASGLSQDTFSVSWIGKSQPTDGNYGVVDPNTGLPKPWPVALTSRQEYAKWSSDPASGDEYIFTRRTAAVSVSAPITKASNAAGDTLEAAVERLKGRLEAAGYTTATQAFFEFLD